MPLPTYQRPAHEASLPLLLGRKGVDATDTLAHSRAGPMTIGCLLQNTMAAARMLGAIPPAD